MLCFLDLDDTIVPTTEFLEFGIDIQDVDDKSYVELDLKVCFLVQEIQKHAQVIIVTNGTAQWLEDCLEILPKFKSLDIPYMSARDQFFKHPQARWKPMTFSMLCSWHPHVTRVMTIGDGMEHLYAMELIGTKNITSSVSFQFKSKPTLYDLYSQLDTCKNIMSDTISISAASHLVHCFQRKRLTDPHIPQPQ